MTLTPEQAAIVEHVTHNDGYTLVDAVAGAGKTSLLVALTKALSPTSALYLAYNKSMATEASRKFPRSVTCCTIHSLAFGPTVTAKRLRLGTFTYRNLDVTISYERRVVLVDYLRQYFLSSHLHFEDFLAAEHIHLSSHELRTLNSVIHQMEDGTLECTHDFYLKYFHILLATDHITYSPFDIIALDEAGDVNPVTLAIMRLLPSAKKILVGDSRQNIYSFNHTINCFAVMRDEDTTFPMSQSFRVSPEIASRVQTFLSNYISPTMHFRGTPQADTTIRSHAYIARTNTTLISKMVDLNELGTPYTLTRSADDIFRLPKFICSLKPNGVAPADFRTIQEEANAYYRSSDLQHSYKSVLSYLKDTYRDDVQVSTAIGLVLKYRAAGIYACYEEAKRHERTSSSYYLGTAHSCKGLEYDEVYIADDLNSAVAELQLYMTTHSLSYDQLSTDQQTELNLYYVACTRAHKRLLNANQLEALYTLPTRTSYADSHDYSRG